MLIKKSVVYTYLYSLFEKVNRTCTICTGAYVTSLFVQNEKKLNWQNQRYHFSEKTFYAIESDFPYLLPNANGLQWLSTCIFVLGHVPHILSNQNVNLFVSFHWCILIWFTKGSYETVVLVIPSTPQTLNHKTFSQPKCVPVSPVDMVHDSKSHPCSGTVTVTVPVTWMRFAGTGWLESSFMAGIRKMNSTVMVSNLAGKLLYNKTTETY